MLTFRCGHPKVEANIYRCTQGEQCRQCKLARSLRYYVEHRRYFTEVSRQRRLGEKHPGRAARAVIESGSRLARAW